MQTQIEGLKDIESVLFKLARSTAKGVTRRVLTKGAEPMRAAAERNAPDDPGTPSPDLHTSISVSAKQKSSRQRVATKEARNEVAIYIGPTRAGYPQAVMMELGTFKDPAQPYMTPAFEAEKAHSLSIIADGFGKELDKTVARIVKRQTGR